MSRISPITVENEGFNRWTSHRDRTIGRDELTVIGVEAVELSVETYHSGVVYETKVVDRDRLLQIEVPESEVAERDRDDQPGEEDEDGEPVGEVER